MKNSFIRLLLRDIKNYIRTNRFFLIAEAALFLIGCMIADMQKPDSYGKYTTIQYYMQIFRGCYPFTDARTDQAVAHIHICRLGEHLHTAGCENFQCKCQYLPAGSLSM